MSRSKELVKNTAIISIGKISTQVINFLLLPLYTAKLSTTDYGNFDFITTIAAFAVPILTMLMEESMFRFLIDAKTEEERSKIITQAFLFSIINGSLITVIIYIFTTLIRYEQRGSLILYMISMVFIALSNALARGTSHITLYSLSNFLSSALIILFNLILILGFHMGFDALVISSVVANIVAAMFVLIKLHVLRYLNPKNLDHRLIRTMLKYSVPLVPNTISWAVINASDRLVIVGFLGASQNGLYSVAYKFPNLITNLNNYFNIAWREASAKMARDRDFSEMRKIYTYTANALFAITILVSSLIQGIYPFFINGNYQESVVYVPILAYSAFYLSLSGFYGGIFSAFKDTGILGTTSFIAAGINLAIDFLFIRKIGVYAAAISTLAASFFLYAYRLVKLRKYVSLFDKKDVIFGVYFCVQMIVFYNLSKILHVLGACISIAVSIYLNKEMIVKIIHGIRNKIKNKH